MTKLAIQYLSIQYSSQAKIYMAEMKKLPSYFSSQANSQVIFVFFSLYPNKSQIQIHSVFTTKVLRYCSITNCYGYKFTLEQYHISIENGGIK